MLFNSLERLVFEMIYYVSNRILSCPYSLMRASLSVAKQHIVISIWQTAVPSRGQEDKRRPYVTVSWFISNYTL